ncbi:class I SAM-dependent methyltransferase [Candidatus Dependentiae bacterium]|nr:class I SAM-dependent methyltransferase [Candidatus Dependentiae bacterium]MBU4387288.1 class I SAM-dependent methyltransferase [Candidatus Dependentiae bacterium]MCG2756645.1 class I SAM-dependent methyltransferase [Candidatus Dependentiae bacterium]
MENKNFSDFYENFFNISDYNSYRYDVGSFCTRQLIISNIKQTSGNLLEIGTGISSIIQDLNNFNCYGIDYSKNAINFTEQILKKLNKKANLTIGNAEKLPYDDNFFDVIITSHTLEHIKNDFNVIKECLRVLKNNGELIIFVPGRVSGISTNEEFTKYGHYRYYNAKRFKELEISTNLQLSLIKIIYPHKIHNLIWNKLKRYFRYANYPIKKFILKDNKSYEERKFYQKILLPKIAYILNKLDNIIEKKEANFLGTEFNVLAVFKKSSI